jgi:uncharacterized protein (DUF362 family)
MRSVTRREFLLRAAGAAAGVELGRRLTGVPAAFAAQTPEPSIPPDWPAAAVVQGTNDDSPSVLLKTALEAVGGISRFVKPGQTVCIKPNCTWDYPPNTASSTDPELLQAVILAVQEAGAKRVIVLDHPTISSAAECLEVSGIGKVLDSLKVEKVFPDRTLAPADTYTLIDLPEGKSYQKMSVIKAATEADVRINMAVAKSHVVLPVTMCLKHMMGFLESPPALHAYLEQGVIDINTESSIHASLHILEAIRVRLKGMAAGFDTDITNPRLVKRFNQLVVGTDPVLIDAYGCINYFGRQPKEVRYVKLAGDQGLGELDVKKATDEGRLRIYQAGEAITKPVPTATATPRPTKTPTGPAPTDAAHVTPSPTLTPSPTVPPPTNTPLPTSTPEPVTAAAAVPAAAARDGAAATNATTVTSPNQFLNGALLPAAAVVTGVGLVFGRRLRKPDAPDTQAPTDQAVDPASPSQEKPA